MDVWQFRMRNFRRLTQGWVSNVIAEQNRHKQQIAEEYNNLDLAVESRILFKSEVNRTNRSARELDRMWALEGIKVKQRSRDMNILEGGGRGGGVKYDLFSSNC